MNDRLHYVICVENIYTIFKVNLFLEERKVREYHKKYIIEGKMKPTKSAIQQCARQTEQLFDLFLNLDTENALRRKKDRNEKNEGIKILSFYCFN